MNKIVRKLQCVLHGHHDELVLVHKMGDVHLYRCKNCGKYTIHHLSDSKRNKRYKSIDKITEHYKPSEWKVYNKEGD